MRDYINIGPTPFDEECAQVGSEDYTVKAKAECLAFLHQLERMFPDGDFRIKSFNHDFGTYHEVVAYYESDADPGADVEAGRQIKAAFDAEADGPGRWDALAKKELYQPTDSLKDAAELDGTTLSDQ